MRHGLLLVTLTLLAVPRLALGQQPTATPLASPSPSPTPFVMPTSAMVLINLVPKPAPIICRIGTNSALMDGTGADPILPGLRTGLIPWLPASQPLRAQAEGYTAAVLRPFLKPGQTPVVLLTERTAGTLSFQVIPNTDKRDGGFYDAINLTAEPVLQITVDGKPVSLPKGKRTRLGTNNTLTYSLPGGGGDSFDSEDAPPQSLLLFYRAYTGKTKCTIVPDILLQ